MAAEILSTTALIDHIQVASDEGITVPLPLATVRRWLLLGRTDCTLHFDLATLSFPEPSAAVDPPTCETISMREAARRMAARMSPLQPRGEEMPLETARSRVRAAIAANRLPQPIDVEAFGAWLDREVDYMLDSLDNAEK